MNGSMKSIIGSFIGIAGALLLFGCATAVETTVPDATLFLDDGTKGRAFLLQKPDDLLKHGFRDGKLAIVNIIGVTGKFGISEIHYGLVLLAHPMASPIPNPEVAAHVHVGDFKLSLGNMPVDHSGWPHYVRVQNFADDPSNLLDVVIACDPKPDPRTRFNAKSEMGVSFGNPYTCDLNPNEVYGNFWGLKVHDYGRLLNGGDTDDFMLIKLQQLRKIMDRFNATVIDKVKRQTVRHH
ncbi:MAG: hypothetical protein CMH81_04095 [Nitrospiraceae bacterium]|nr:hypothetical protein [Nitrospiraceae bacterium]|tara:strand:+ start:420 stop:1133 length:714 start_codon:yes stop_codon:yes gene_type:complete